MIRVIYTKPKRKKTLQQRMECNEYLHWNFAAYLGIIFFILSSKLINLDIGLPGQWKISVAFKLMLLENIQHLFRYHDKCLHCSLIQKQLLCSLLENWVCLVLHKISMFWNQEQSHSYRRKFSEYKVSSHFFLKIEIKLSLLGMCKIFVRAPEQSGMT